MVIFGKLMIAYVCPTCGENQISETSIYSEVYREEIIDVYEVICGYCGQENKVIENGKYILTD